MQYNISTDILCVYNDVMSALCGDFSNKLHVSIKLTLCCATIWAFSKIESDILIFGVKFEVEIH